MQAQRVMFTAPNVVELQTFEFDPTPGPTEVTIRTLVSIISAGTELACLRGTESWARLPLNPGYGSVGEVIALGSQVQGLKVGDWVLTYGKHASHTKARVMALPLPKGLEPTQAVFARMANVSITALRVSPPELGDRVAVIGMGLVGNFAAQLSQLAGCEVIAIDQVEARLERARACGIANTVNARATDPVEAVKVWSEGKGCELVIEASGTPQGALLAVKLAAKQGTVVLLGSPREPLETNITELLQHVHLWQHGCVTLKGAHEWRYPVEEDPHGFAKHSIERNAKVLLRLILQGKLQVFPLLTHRFPPQRCAEAYQGLRERPEEFLGVVFDWTALGEDSPSLRERP